MPPAEIDDSLERVPASVELLTPQADFVAVVDNSGGCPQLVGCCDNGECYPTPPGGREDEWDQISRLIKPSGGEECDIVDYDDPAPDETWAELFRQSDFLDL